MFGQIVGAGKALATCLTVIRPLSGVDTQVTGQIGFTAERSSAKQTDKRALAGVLADVQLKVLLGTYTFAAEWTCKTATVYSNRNRATI